MGPDLTNKHWIIVKGLLFLILALFSGTLQLIADLPRWQEAVLLGICVWSACRFYYFLFHVLHAYVGLPSAGLLDLLKHLSKRP